MNTFKLKVWQWTPSIILIIVVSLFVFWPSFKLALTGDDYLGLWRYEETMAGRMPGPSTPISYFFIDYGPQDIGTVVIHHFFGFNPLPYYIISFLLRLLATISFIPLIVYLTKSKQAAFLSSIFFAVCTTGLETTDWSFNMPSYLAIAILNFFLIVYFLARKTNNIFYTIFALLLFLTTIVVQPIRMAFLPLAILGVEVFGILQLNSAKKEFLFSILRIILFVSSFILLIKSTSIGAQAGGLTNQGGTSSAFAHYTDGIKVLFEKEDYEKLLTPIWQLGSIIIPDTVYPKRFDSYSVQSFVWIIIVPLFALFCLIIKYTKTLFGTEKKSLRFGIYLTAGTWNWIVFTVYKTNSQYPPSNSQTLIILFGGYFFITTFFLILAFWKKEIALYLVAALFLIGLSYAIPWLRTPGSMNLTVGRYLIVSAAGYTVFMGLLIAQSKRPVAFILFAFLPVFLLHFSASKKYLGHLASVREGPKTEKIRQSFVLNEKADADKDPLVYYFESDNPDMLHHAVLFGFPMFMKYYHNAQNPWNIAYTTSWKEVYDAHIDGSGLKRFTGNIQPIPVEHIYGYKIESGELRDITKEVREKVMKEELSSITR